MGLQSHRQLLAYVHGDALVLQLRASLTQVGSSAGAPAEVVVVLHSKKRSSCCIGWPHVPWIALYISYCQPVCVATHGAVRNARGT